jgi:nuclear GTP-binding protein
MYRGGKAVVNKKGHVIGGSLMSIDKVGDRDITGATGRVQPDRRWFGNTRVVGQKEMDTFRDEFSARMSDPYSGVCLVLTRATVVEGVG